MGSVAARVAMYQTVGRCLVLTVNSSVKRGTFFGGGGGWGEINIKRAKEERREHLIFHLCF